MITKNLMDLASIDGSNFPCNSKKWKPHPKRFKHLDIYYLFSLEIGFSGWNMMLLHGFYGLRWPSRVIHLKVHQEVDPSLGASCRRRGAPEDGLVEDEVVVLLGVARGGVGNQRWMDGSTTLNLKDNPLKTNISHEN